MKPIRARFRAFFLTLRTPARLQPVFGERGATAVEYSLMVTLIAIAIIGGVTYFGGELNTLFSNDANKI